MADPHIGIGGGAGSGGAETLRPAMAKLRDIAAERDVSAEARQLMG